MTSDSDPAGGAHEDLPVGTDSGAELRRPVSDGSILCHHPSVRYTELLGMGILCRIDTKAVSALSPGAAAAWARFDGRTPLSALGSGSELMELARRLRAVGALVDQAPTDPIRVGDPRAAADAPIAAGSGRTTVTLRATWRLTEAGDGAVIELATLEPADADDGPTATVTIDADRVTIGETPVERIVIAGGDAGDPPLGTLQALEQLITDIDTADLARPGCLDALAELAEQVPVVGPPPSGLDDGPPPFDRLPPGIPPSG